MDPHRVVENICNLPSDFERIHTISTIALVQRSGYLENPAALSREAVAAHLRKNPALVNEWQLWCDNQRSSPAWVLAHNSKDYFTVYLFPDGEKEPMVFHNAYDACAEFIVRHTEQVAAITTKMVR